MRVTKKHQAKLDSYKERKYDFYFGIDTGSNTAVAVWQVSTNSFVFIKQMKIHRAMIYVLKTLSAKHNFFVAFEDARLVKFFGKTGEISAEEAQNRKQGAGYVKRDGIIWEDFLTDSNVPYTGVRPDKKNTKLKMDAFRQKTGYLGPELTEHEIDAGMIAYKQAEKAGLVDQRKIATPSYRSGKSV